MKGFIEIPCSCGTKLRSPEEKAGELVACWNCRAEMVIPYPNLGGKLTRESMDHVRWSLRAGPFFFALLCGMATAVVLAIPRAGPILAIGLLTAAGLRYRAIVRRTGLHGTPDPEPRPSVSRGKFGLRVAGAFLASLGLTFPFLLRYGIAEEVWLPGPSHGGLVLAMATLACWVAVPLAVMATSAADRAGPLSAREALATALRHPIFLAITLLILPATVALVELGIYVLAWEQGWFRFMIEDLFPRPLGLPRGLEYYEFSPPTFADCPDPRLYTKTYTDGLRRGFTLFGGLVGTLPRGLNSKVHPINIQVEPWAYLLVRVLFAGLGMAVVGSCLAIQARWLGLLPSLDARRPGPSRRGRVA